MRILFVSNLYPPFDLGGYEKHCHEVATRLQARGHSVFVLTGRYGSPGPVQEDGIWRTLFLECNLEHYDPVHFFTRRWQEERHNGRALLTMVDEFRPHVIMFWGMWMLSRNLPSLAEASDVPVAYMIEDLWPVSEDVHTWYWRMPTRRPFVRSLKSLAARLAFAHLRLDGYPPVLRFEHVVCGSHFLREKIAEIIPAFKNAEVVMCGIELEPFFRVQYDRSLDRNGAIRVIYVGGLNPDKGVHTVVRSLAHVLEMAPDLRPRLTIVGSGHPEYENYLHDLVGTLGIEDQVQFLGSVPKEQIPGILYQHDIQVVPSVWEEPFGRVVVEGMAAGLVVVGTGTGGSGEILIDGVNGLVFPPEDAAALAEQLARLACNPDLHSRLAKAGQKTAASFDISEMADGIEGFLARQLGGRQDKQWTATN